MASPAFPSGEGTRRRRGHTKSRQGCRNCKLRHVKCDEGLPQCHKCLTFGVVCNYNKSQSQDLQPASPVRPSGIQPGGSFGEIVFNLKPRPSSVVLQPVTVIGSGPGSFQLDAESIAALDRFLRRTSYTFVGDHVHNVFRNDVTSIALENPFLMHIILTFTASHDRFLSMSNDNAKRTMYEAYHWLQGAALLNKKLSAPILPRDRDALWAAAAILGLLSVAEIEAQAPWEAWPLKTSDPSDLGWLEINHGKEAIWKATDPMRPDSIFHVMRDDYRVLMIRPPLCEIHDMPAQMVELCQLHKLKDPTQSPYFTAVSLLTRLWHLKCTQATMIRYMQFLGFMEPAFKSLLRKKDPRALLILAFWYGPMCEALWWMAKRARLECQAICVYLELFHPDEKDIHVLLARPKEQCGLLFNCGDTWKNILSERV